MTDVAKNPERTATVSLDFVTAHATEVVWRGDDFARTNQEVVMSLMQANREVATTASIEEIALALVEINGYDVSEFDMGVVWHGGSIILRANVQ